MKTIVSGGSINICDEEFRVWGNNRKRLYKEIVLRIHNQMSAMLDYHCKILVVRFDFRMTEYSEGNELISGVFRVLKKQLSKRYKMKRIGHIWVREQNTSEQQHYHCALMLDANKVRHPAKIFERLESICVTRDQLPPSLPKNPYYIVARGDTEAFSNAFYRLSYLAKIKTKDQRVGSNNDYSTSKIKRR